MSEMKITYELETPWPTDIANPEGLECITWTKEGIIPFMPFIGLHIDSGDGDLREIKQVYWWSETPDVVGVYMEDDAQRELSYSTRGGWSSNDLPATPKPPRARKEATA